MRKPVTPILSIAAILLFSGCATIIRGTHEPLQLSSSPEGVTAQLSNGQSCTTPCSLDEERDASFSITFSKDGCDSQTVSVFPTLAGAGVILGGLIDYGTGAVYSLQPNPVVTTLKCKELAQAAAPAALTNTAAVSTTANAISSPPSSPPVNSVQGSLNGDLQRGQ